MWLFIGSDQWDEAQAMYDELPPARQEAPLNLEELSIMRASQGRCDEALASIDKAHDGQIRIHGEVSPNFNRSNSSLALNRVHCLRQLGRESEAEPIIAALRNYIDTLRSNTVHGIYKVDAKLRVLDGDIDGAVQVLDDARVRNELGWPSRFDPILRTLGDDPGFQAVFSSLDSEIDALRAELGMPPAGQ